GCKQATAAAGHFDGDVRADVADGGGGWGIRIRCIHLILPGFVTEQPLLTSLRMARSLGFCPLALSKASPGATVHGPPGAGVMPVAARAASQPLVIRRSAPAVRPDIPAATAGSPGPDRRS